MKMAVILLEYLSTIESNSERKWEEKLKITIIIAQESKKGTHIQRNSINKIKIYAKSVLFSSFHSCGPYANSA